MTSDPFSDRHASDQRSTDKAVRDAAQKQITTAAQARMAATKKAGERPANWDIENHWKTFRHFYDPKGWS